MELLNRDEHMHCADYADANSRTFKIFSFSKGEKLKKKITGAHYILLLLKGAIEVYWTDMPKSVVDEGSMSLFPKNTCIYGEVLSDCVLMSCRLGDNIDFCNRYNLTNLRTDANAAANRMGGGILLIFNQLDC